MTRSRDVADTQDNLGGAVPPFVAGKNRIINGDFGVWARGTSFTVNNNILYTADRWILLSLNTGGNVVASQQTFAPGTAPVAGYEGTYFLRNTATSPTGAAYNVWQHKIEDVRTLAGQTATISFWAKADTTRTIYSQFFQNFGTGGSTEVYTGTSYPYSLTTSWQRFTTTLTFPSIAGKTIGTGSNLRLEFSLPTNVSSTIDIWGVQLEAGSVATPFTPAGGGFPGAELALCQRYYQTLQGSQYYDIGLAAAIETTQTATYFNIPTMRTAPTCSFSGTLYVYMNGAITYPSAYSVGPLSQNGVYLFTTVSGLTRGYTGRITGHTTPFNLQMSSEL